MKQRFIESDLPVPTLKAPNQVKEDSSEEQEEEEEENEEEEG